MSDITTHLGKKSQYQTSKIDPTLLAIEPRVKAREENSILNLPWDTGFDVWHAYETSFRIRNEFVTGITKMVVPSTTDNIIESKSLKLYLFSLSEETFESKQMFERVVATHITKALDCGPADVQVRFYTEGYTQYFDKKVTLDNMYESPHLRSNCKITNQPDYANLFVNSDQPLDKVGIDLLVRSLRHENHFHEECVELLFDRILKTYPTKYLQVYAKYTRRGGIDIWPYRSLGMQQHPLFIMPTKLTHKTFRG